MCRGDEVTVRPARRKLSDLGDAFRRLRPYFQGFKRDQPEQNDRDWCPAETATVGDGGDDSLHEAAAVGSSSGGLSAEAHDRTPCGSSP